MNRPRWLFFFSLILLPRFALSLDEVQLRVVLRAYTDFNSLRIGAVQLESEHSTPASCVGVSFSGGTLTSFAFGPPRVKVIDKRFDSITTAVTTTGTLFGGVSTFVNQERHAWTAEGQKEAFQHTKAYVDLRNLIGGLKADRLAENLAARWGLSRILASQFAGEDRAEVERRLFAVREKIYLDPFAKTAREQNWMREVQTAKIFYALEMIKVMKSTEDKKGVEDLLVIHAIQQKRMRDGETIQKYDGSQAAERTRGMMEIDLHRGERISGLKERLGGVLFVDEPPQTWLGRELTPKGLPLAKDGPDHN